VSSLLPEVIRSFRAAHPGVVFELKEAGSRDIARAVAHDELEIGIVTAPVRDAALETAPLTRDRIVLVASERNPLAQAARVDADALQGAPLIGFEAGSAIRDIIDRALDARGVRVNVVMELRSIQSILRMVGLDLGLAFVSRLGVGAPADHRVRVLSVTGLSIERKLAIVTKRGRTLSIASAAFLEHLRRHAP
jgi:DNA-binding transcriptional LysR family regulator